jgi:hypothetical protein
MREQTGTNAYRCGLCQGAPRYELEREGDVRVTWACESHLGLVLSDLLPPDRHRDVAQVKDLWNVWAPAS